MKVSPTLEEPQSQSALRSVAAFALQRSCSIVKRPVLLCLLTAAGSVILSCYPVVFFGKSFLSPNNHSGTYLLYGKLPTVPGYYDTTTDDEKGSDLGAAMWYSWPTSVVESRALLKYHELPLWNRYDSTGVPLLGQGQSMFGDPLHLLVILGKGSAVVWDMKFLLAKTLFCFCIGLCVLRLSRHLPAALIITASSAFIGFFSYRYSHPAFFTLCYAPTILLSWFQLITARQGRTMALWLGGLVTANWMVMNSGTVKEAYILLLAMNACGLLALLFAQNTGGGKRNRLRDTVCALFLFVLISTPVWLIFLHTLRSSGTASESTAAYQLQPSLIIGLFDDIFYRQFNAGETHLDPSTNFLILLAVLWFIASPQVIGDIRVSRVVGAATIAALAIVFGVVPPSLIGRLPFLGNILHIDDTFSCVAIICLLVLAGLGAAAFYRDCYAAHFRLIYLRVVIYLALLIGLYFGTTQAAQRSTTTLLKLGQQVPKSAFFWGYFQVLLLVVLLAPWLGRFAIVSKRWRLCTVFLLAALFLLLHWRNGMHLRTSFDAYVMNPHQRVSLIAKSPALDLLKKVTNEPSRAVGLDSNFSPGYGGAVGLEQIDGPDPLFNRDFRSLMQAAGVELVLGAWRYSTTTERLSGELRLFDMLNVRYYLSSTGKAIRAAPSLKKVASLDLDVYESAYTWPRAFFTNKITVSANDHQLIQQLANGDGRPFAAISSAELPGRASLRDLVDRKPASVALQTIPATNYIMSANATSFTIDAPGPGVVVLSESYLGDDFEVHLNKERANYFRVNSAFKGIFLDHAGHYLVSFVYWPRSFTTALWLSAIGIAALLCWLIAMAKIASSQLAGAPECAHEDGDASTPPEQNGSSLPRS